MHGFVPIYMLIKIFKKIIQFQPIKSYILWKLMTPTITWPTDKVDNDNVDEDIKDYKGGVSSSRISRISRDSTPGSDMPSALGLVDYSINLIK